MIKYPAIKILATSKPQHKYAISSTCWFISTYCIMDHTYVISKFHCRKTIFHPYWTHLDSTFWPRRLINEMFELNIYLFFQNHNFLQLSLLSDPSLWTIVSSWKLTISAFSNLFHILFDLSWPRSTSILFDYPG